MAQRVAAAAEAAGAEVRVRHVAETRDPESFAQNPAWTANYEAHQGSAARDRRRHRLGRRGDLRVADAIRFGRRRNCATSSIRSAGCGRRASSPTRFTRRSRRRKTAHGGQETTLLSALHHADALRRHHRAAGLHRCAEVRRRKPLRRQPRSPATTTSASSTTPTDNALDHLARRVVTVADRLTCTRFWRDLPR